MCEGRSVLGHWNSRLRHWHINMLELLIVHLALRQFCPMLAGENAFIRSDNTATRLTSIARASDITVLDVLSMFSPFCKIFSMQGDRRRHSRFAWLLFWLVKLGGRESCQGPNPPTSRFLKGTRCLRPQPVGRSVGLPPWDLVLVLRALMGPPFEPMECS